MTMVTEIITPDNRFVLASAIGGYNTTPKDAVAKATPIFYFAQAFWGQNSLREISNSILNDRSPKSRGVFEITANAISREEDGFGSCDLHVFPDGFCFVDERWYVTKNKFTETYKYAELPKSGWWVPDTKYVKFEQIESGIWFPRTRNRQVILAESGPIMYHPQHGFPLRTLPYWQKEQAMKELEKAGFNPNDISYIAGRDDGIGVTAVSIGSIGGEYGRFYVNMFCRPDEAFEGVGFRSCRKLS